VSRVRLYLDVDGVINAWYAGSVWVDSPLQEGIAAAGGYNYRIKWSADMVSALSQLDVDLCWATTWVGAAPTTLAPLIGYGMDSRYLRPLSGKVSFPSIYWKEAAIREEQLRDPSPFIWIDDEIGWDQQIIASSLGGLAISPDHQFGITPADIGLMQEYIDTYIELEEEYLDRLSGAEE
jgi:hypothetical protein